MSNLYHDKFEKLEDDDYAKKAKENTVVNHQLILETAISKAIEGGWKWMSFLENINAAYLMPEKIKHWRCFIFDTNFALSLWGADTITIAEDAVNIVQHEEDEPTTVIIAHTAWQYHLQQMVIAPDPIEYLGANI